MLCSYLIMSGNRVRGFQVGAGASAPLAAIMAYRAINAGKFMPAGTVFDDFTSYCLCVDKLFYRIRDSCYKQETNDTHCEVILQKLHSIFQKSVSERQRLLILSL